MILVTNGVYATGGRVADGLLTNRVVVTKAVRVESVNGPEVTVICGYQVPGTTNGDSAVRCAYLANGAVLAGFTLTNGATRSSGDGLDDSGGGVVCPSSFAMVSHCWLVANSAMFSGGGVYKGLVRDCVLENNRASFGGGASWSTLTDCTLIGNRASWTGGGAGGGTLRYCTLKGNGAVEQGGGAYQARLDYCLVTQNTAREGGGAFECTLAVCGLTENSAVEGGAAYGGTLRDSTLVGNRGFLTGGGCV